MKTIYVTILAVAAGAVGGCLLMHYCKKKKCKCCGDKADASTGTAAAPVTGAAPVMAIVKDQQSAESGTGFAAADGDGGHGPGWPTNAKAW